MPTYKETIVVPVAEERYHAYDAPRIFEKTHTRTLRFDAFSVQSSMRLNAPFELDLAYTRAMMGFQLFQPHPQDILIVGLGGGSMSKYCYDKFPSARITTVEIDPRVVALRDEFCIPRDSDRFRIVLNDAATYISGLRDVTDVILLDGFNASGLPSALSNQAFYDKCYTALRSQGVMAVNLLSSDMQMATYLRRIKRSCQGHLFRTVAWEAGNTIAFGVKDFVIPDWKHLHARAKMIRQRTNLNLAVLVQRMEHNYRRQLVDEWSDGKISMM